LLNADVLKLISKELQCRVTLFALITMLDIANCFLRQNHEIHTEQ